LRVLVRVRVRVLLRVLVRVRVRVLVRVRVRVRVLVRVRVRVCVYIYMFSRRGQDARRQRHSMSVCRMLVSLSTTCSSSERTTI